MKAGWKYVDFNKCIQKIPKQKQVKSKDYLTSGLFPIVSQEMELVSGYWNDESFLYKIDKPIVVFGDHTKVIKYIDFDFVVGADGTQLLKPIDQLDTKFFYYFLKSIILGDLGYARHFKLLKQVPIPLPSLSEQGEIVAYLDKEFALIDALREKATLQLQAAKDLFQSVYDSALSPKQSWCFKKLKDVAIYRRGSFPQPYGNTEWYGGVGEMPFVQVAELQEDNLNLMFPTRKNISKLAQPMSVFVPAGSVLVSLQGSIGKVAISQYDSYVDRTVAIFFDYKEKMDKTFFAYSLKRKFAEERLKARGTTIKTITKEEFAEFSIPLPTLSEQEEIVRKLDALSEKCRQLEENYRQTITLCNDLKQALLRQVFE